MKSPLFWITVFLLLPSPFTALAAAPTQADLPPTVSAAPGTSKVAWAGDHQITIVRIAAPSLPVPSLPTAPVPSAADQLADQRRAGKTFVQVGFSATVFPGIMTELNWQHDGRAYRAYSNVDFRLLSDVPVVETADTVYSVFFVPVIGDLSAATVEEQAAAKLRFSSIQAQYLVVTAPNEGLVIAPNSTTVGQTLSWWGRAGRAYFIQYSTDLVTWNYLQVVEGGNNAVIQYGVSSAPTSRLCFGSSRPSQTDATDYARYICLQFDSGDRLCSRSSSDDLGWLLVCASPRLLAVNLVCSHHIFRLVYCNPNATQGF